MWDAVTVGKLLGLAALILASGFFSSSEAAFFSLGFHRVRRLKAVAHHSYLAAQKLIKDPTKLISTLLTGNEVVNSLIGVVGSSLVYRQVRNHVFPEYLPLVAVAVVLPFVLVFGEIIPKTFGIKFPERMVTLNALPLYWFSRAIAPLRDGLAWIVDTLVTLLGGNFNRPDTVSEAVFRSMVDAGTEEGVLDFQERRLIHNVFDLDDLRIERIMTPKSKVSSLRLNMTIEEALNQIASDRYSRFPVLDEREERVVGTLYIKDLLGLSLDQQRGTISSYVRSALRVAQETTALHLFAQFRAQRTHFGVVCGTFAHEMVGVVTLEDVLEEIFGDLRDERDVEEAASKL